MRKAVPSKAIACIQSLKIITVLQVCGVGAGMSTVLAKTRERVPALASIGVWGKSGNTWPKEAT